MIDWKRVTLSDEISYAVFALGCGIFKQPPKFDYFRDCLNCLSVEHVLKALSR